MPLVLAVRPRDDDLLEMHFVVTGTVGSPYDGGEYWGRFRFPATYPNAPPDLEFFTPSGRFEPGKKICTSFTAFHPESWNPMWTLNTLLSGVISFMDEDQTTAGSINASWAERRRLAAASWAWNAAQPQFRALFSDLCLEERGRALQVRVTAEVREQSRRMVLYTAVAVVAVLVFAVVRVWRGPG